MLFFFFFPFSGGLDLFLRTKLELQALSLSDYRAGGGHRRETALSNPLSPQYSVVKIVREKYLKTTAFETKEQLQSFLSELYVYLVDHMHIALNKVGGNLGHGFTLGPGQVKNFCFQDKKSRLMLSSAGVADVAREPHSRQGSSAFVSHCLKS